MPSWIANNPAAFIGALRGIVLAIMGLLAAFGLPVTEAQKTALLEFTAAIVPVALLFSAVSHQLTVPKEPTPDPPEKSLQVVP